MKYVVDTNIINWLVDAKIDRAALPSDGTIIATHIQIDELNRTSDEERRARLFLILASTIRELVPTESAVFDVSRFDNCKLGDGVIYSSIKAALDARNGKRRRANIHDALIGEVAIKNSYMLLTADADLAEVTREHKGQVRHFAVQPPGQLGRARKRRAVQKVRGRARRLPGTLGGCERSG